MNFNIVNLKQGSPEWKAYRAQHFNASDAPAMMACSPNKTRGELIKELASGIEREFSDFVQERILDKGHEFEALCRPLAEQEMGETLYPVVGNNGIYSASFDGLDLMEAQGWEHKRLNAALREAMYDGSTGTDLPLMYQVQMEHQAMACPTLERILFSASDWDRQGGLIEVRHCWYTPNPELHAQIVSGWDLIEKDVLAYDPIADAAPEVVGQAPDQLPALRIDVQGMVTASNLDGFKAVALRTLGSIKTKLVTDQDFADADKTVKWCGNVESSLAAAKEHALSQTESIDRLFKTIDEISEQTRAVRLKLEKLVKSEKEARKEQIVVTAQRSLDDHIANLNADLGARYLASPGAVFAPVAKGLKSLDSMTDKVQAELARQTTAADATAARYKANRDHLMQQDGDWITLFPDFSNVGGKAAEDFEALAALRIGNARQAEAKRLEDQRTKIREEEAAKLKKEADDAADAKKKADDEAVAEKLRMDNEEMQRQQDLEQQALDATRAPQVIAPEAIEEVEFQKEGSAPRLPSCCESAPPGGICQGCGTISAALQADMSPRAAAAEAAAEPASTQSTMAGYSYSRRMAADPAPEPAAVIDPEATMTLGQINTLIAPIKVDAAGLAELGFETTAVKGAKHLPASDVPKLLAAMVKHLEGLLITT